MRGCNNIGMGHDSLGFNGDSFLPLPPPLSCCVAVIEVPVPLPLNLEEYPRSQQVETSDSSESDSELPSSPLEIPDSQAKYVDPFIHPSPSPLSIHPLSSSLSSPPPSFLLLENLAHKCTI